MLRVILILLCIAGCQSPTVTPTAEESRLIYPTLTTLEPAEAAPGDTVKVSATGGYLEMGDGGYNESARSFDLLLDEEVIGELSCYAGMCFAEFVVPDSVGAGEHLVSTEGSSSLVFTMTLP
jgi:hypothetical protein